MLSQLGYVCLFSSAFPLAAMAALLGNLLELRGDAFKLCFVLQRPFGRRVSNIGTWQVSKRKLIYKAHKFKNEFNLAKIIEKGLHNYLSYT